MTVTNNFETNGGTTAEFEVGERDKRYISTLFGHTEGGGGEGVRHQIREQQLALQKQRKNIIQRCPLFNQDISNGLSYF